MVAHNAIDKTGTKFNMLTAIERVPNYKNGKTYYKCKCECGNIKYISNDKIGKTYSCGCKTTRGLHSRINRVGQRFGKLTVTKMLYNYKSNQTYVECRCDCGNTTIVYVGNVVSGKTKSCGCEETNSRFDRIHEKDLSGMKFGHLTVLHSTSKRYSNQCVGWLCKCDCGNDIIVRSSNLLRGKTRSCGCNKTSKLEEYVEEILDEYGITYDREYRFAGCKNCYTLPFDFHIVEQNKEFCIECQGQQHYEPIKHFGGEKRFITTKRNDSIKEKFCKDNNITLIRLPYTMSKQDMKNKIIETMNILDPVTITA